MLAYILKCMIMFSETMSMGVNKYGMLQSMIKHELSNFFYHNALSDIQVKVILNHWFSKVE